jgi:hypothetical protein
MDYTPYQKSFLFVISLSHVTKSIVFNGIDTYTNGKHEVDFYDGFII